MATVVDSSRTIAITFGDGVTFAVPHGLSGGMSSTLPNWHEYYATETLGRISDGWSVQKGWETLLKSPAPGTLLGGGPAVTGSVTDTYGPGSVWHIVDGKDNIVLNVTYEKGSTDILQHMLYPGAVVRHVYVKDGFVVIESVGVGNSSKLGPISAWFNRIMGEGIFGQPSGRTLELMMPQCFPSDTSVSMVNSVMKPISEIRVGDTVMSFDPAADGGRGALVPKRVKRLFRNSTTEWIKLTWLENGEAKELVATPGHHMLDKTGAFTRLDRMVQNGKAEIVLASGEVVEAQAERIIYSTETAHLFERVSSSPQPATIGAAALVN